MQDNTQVSPRVQDSIGIMDISGEVTSFSEKIIEETYEKFSKDGLQTICLSFEKVKYINSAGMAIIIGLLTKSRKREQELRCWGLTDHFQKIFDMVGITKYMKHFPDEAAGLEGK